MRSWSIFMIMCGAFIVGGCAEVIDLDTEPGPSQLLVFGRFTSGLEGNQVQLATTTTFNGNQVPVNGARVTLVTENGDREDYVRINDGLYELNNTEIVGQTGMEYHIEIALLDGRQYRSEPARMPGRVGKDYLDFQTRTTVSRTRNNLGLIRRNVVEFFMRTEIENTEQDPFIRWTIFETYLFPELARPVNSPDQPPLWCYITNELDAQAILLHDGSELNVSEIPRRSMFQRKHDSTFVSAYYFLSIQASLPEDAFRYWQRLDEVSNTKGSIFDTPMGPIRGNIYNVDDPQEHVLGYFEVSHVDTTWVLVDDEDVPFRVDLPCVYSANIPPECLDCLVLDNAIKSRPHFID